MFVFRGQADYIMDDTNSTIQYYGQSWGPLLGQFATAGGRLDTTKLFNGSM